MILGVISMNEKDVSVYTSFLYSQPSFIEGMARVVDFGNTLQKYNGSSSSKSADERAIRADWLAVGKDMTEAIEIIVLEKKL